MFKFVQKLKQVKNLLKEMNKNSFSQIHIEDTKASIALQEAQKAMHLNPASIQARDKEHQAAKDYQVVHAKYVSFLQQKSKLAWVKSGDENPKMFHNAIKSRRLQKTIYGVADIDGNWAEGTKEVNKAFLQYYIQLLGTSTSNRSKVQQEVVLAGVLLNEEQRVALMVPFATAEVKKAIFSIPGEKSASPEGFGSAFYKDAWSFVGEECTAAVLDLFQSRKLLK